MLRALINQNNDVLEWPMWDSHVRAMFPNVSLPEGVLDDVDLTHLGLVCVPPSAKPAPVGEGMKVVLDIPVLIDGAWVRTYKEVPNEGDA